MTPAMTRKNTNRARSKIRVQAFRPLSHSERCHSNMSKRGGKAPATKPSGRNPADDIRCGYVSSATLDGLFTVLVLLPQRSGEDSVMVIDMAASGENLFRSVSVKEKARVDVLIGSYAPAHFAKLSATAVVSFLADSLQRSSPPQYRNKFSCFLDIKRASCGDGRSGEEWRRFRCRGRSVSADRWHAA